MAAEFGDDDSDIDLEAADDAALTVAVSAAANTIVGLSRAVDDAHRSSASPEELTALLAQRWEYRRMTVHEVLGALSRGCYDDDLFLYDGDRLHAI